jgi:lipocalin
MKSNIVFFTLAIFANLGIANAQTKIPDGYKKTSVQLFNGTSLNGYSKDNIKKSASVVFIENETAKKITYDGSQINSIKIDNDNFLCVGGDFFKIISEGKLTFVQKQSNAADKVSYNGSEAVFNSGTEGKMGDYFIYSNNKLKLINKKSVASFIEIDLAGNVAAIEKAKTIDGDLSKLKEAINIYNNN